MGSRITQQLCAHARDNLFHPIQPLRAHFSPPLASRPWQNGPHAHTQQHNSDKVKFCNPSTANFSHKLMVFLCKSACDANERSPRSPRTHQTDERIKSKVGGDNNISCGRVYNECLTRRNGYCVIRVRFFPVYPMRRLRYYCRFCDRLSYFSVGRLEIDCSILHHIRRPNRFDFEWSNFRAFGQLGS